MGIILATLNVHRDSQIQNTVPLQPSTCKILQQYIRLQSTTLLSCQLRVFSTTIAYFKKETPAHSLHMR